MSKAKVAPAKPSPVLDAKPKPGATQKALKAGPHGKQKNSDGSLHFSSNPHKQTSGGNGGLKL